MKIINCSSNLKILGRGLSTILILSGSLACGEASPVNPIKLEANVGGKIVVPNNPFECDYQYDSIIDIDPEGLPFQIWGQTRDCTNAYAVGEIGQMNAVPDPGFRFVGWTGDVCTGQDENCEFTTPSSPSSGFSESRALFEVDQNLHGNKYRVLRPINTVNSDIGNWDCQSPTQHGQCEAWFDSGETLSLTISEPLLFDFDYWLGICGNTPRAETCSLTVNSVDQSINLSARLKYEPGSLMDDIEFVDAGMQACWVKRRNEIYPLGGNLIDQTVHLSALSVLICSEGVSSLETVNGVDGLSKAHYLQVLSLDHGSLVDFTAPLAPSLDSISLMNNELANVDLSRATNLSNLNLGSNPIANIDLSSNQQLTYLNVQNTGLAILDVTNNPKLLNLTFSYTNFESLDLESNPSLLTITAINSSLESINITANTSLESVILAGSPINAIDISMNTELESLHLQSCGLTTINIDNNPKLIDLDLTGNPLTTEARDYLAAKEAANPNLQIHY